MTGETLSCVTLESVGGHVEMRVVRPEPSLDNVRELVRTHHVWRKQAEKLPEGEARFHAEFAAEVAWRVASRLRSWAEEPTRHVIVVGVDEASGAILGINTAYWVAESQTWYLAVGTTRPQDQPGYPATSQVRGIGLGLLGALLDVINGIVCAPVELEPLDAASREFWLRRGFHDQGEEMRLSCPESEGLAASLHHAGPDDPSVGDCPLHTDRVLIPS